MKCGESSKELIFYQLFDIPPLNFKTQPKKFLLLKEIRSSTPNPPKGLDKLKWYGPGLIWMISSVGSGSVLFTPRIGSRYEYELMWISLIIFIFMWVMIKEVGRYTVVTGKSILDGFTDLPGPRGWAIWFIFIPQLIAAVVTIAGIAALAGSALMIALPGDQKFYSVLLIVFSIILVVSGRYKWVEKATSIMSGVLVLVVVITVFKVFPSQESFFSGFIPTIPSNFDIDFVMPWIGFILAGAAGILWYSYWVVAREYGGPQAHPSDIENYESDDEYQDEDKKIKLKKWLKIMDTTAAIGVAGGGIIIISFLILGAELLSPAGIVPEGIAVAEDLTQLLSQVWGQIGYWLLISAMVIALGGTVLSNQDGWGRMFADATLILLYNKFRNSKWIKFKDEVVAYPSEDLPIKGQTILSFITTRRKLKSLYAVVFGAILPLVVFIFVREPVDILSLAGIVAAAHTPFVVFLTLYLNYTRLPSAYKPGIFSSTIMVLSGLFFTGFAFYHFLNL